MTRFGRYEIQAELGRGGFGRVYRAFDPTVGRMVAIKTLNAGGDAELLKRFRNEAAAAGKLRHRNIITIYDFGEQDGEPFIVMELLEGMDLQRAFASGRPMTLLEKMKIMDQIAEGLHHAHTKGVVHRDVKPANMMLLPDASVKIMDFGIALVTQSAGTRLTRTGTIPGTLRYMAPEQFKGSNNDPVSDIFSYAVMYYELLSGRHPFDGPTQPAIMFKIMSAEAPSIRETFPDCPELLEQVLQKALVKERDLRYQTLEDIQFDLRPLMLELQHEGSRELVALAGQQADRGDWESAQVSVRQALELDPRNREAVQLRRRLQQEQQRLAVGPKVESLIQTSRELLSTGEFQGAISNLESALNLDKTSREAASLLDTARSAMEQKKVAEQLAGDALRALKAGDVTAAYRKAGEALQRDPTSTRAGTLMAQVRREMETRERARKLEHSLKQARGALLLEGFDSAIETLVALEAEFPRQPEIAELLERARREKDLFNRRKQLDARMESAKAQLNGGEFAPAVQALEALRTEFPESGEVGELLEYAREGLVTQRRTEHLERLQREVKALTSAGNYDAAIEMLNRGMTFYPGEQLLDDLLGDVQSEKASAVRSAALEQTSASAETLCRDGRFAEALKVVAAFEQNYGVEAGLGGLRGRINAGKEAQSRGEAIGKAMATARRQLERGELQQAVEGLEQTARQYTADGEVAGLLEQARERMAERRKKAEVSRILEQASQFTSTQRFDQALELLKGGEQSFPEAGEMREARQAAATAKARFEREQQRKGSLQKVLSAKPAELAVRMEAHVREFGEEAAFGALRERERARTESLSAISRLGFDEQKKAIEAHVSEFGEDPSVMAIRARLAVRDQSLQKVRASKPAELAAAVEAHVREFGEEAAFGALRDRERARVESLNAIGSLGFDEQKKAIEAHVREFGEDPRFPALRAWLAARDHSLEKVRASKPAELAAAMEAHVREFGEEAAFGALRDRERARTESFAAINRLGFDEQKKAIEAHVREFGEDPRFPALRARVAARDHSLEKVRASKPAELAAAMEAHVREFGEEAAFGALRDRERARVESLNAIGSLGFDEQKKAIEAHVREFGEDPRFPALRAWLAARDHSLEKVRASKPAELAAAIEAHVREFGEEAAFGSLRERARVESLTAIGSLGFDEQKKAIEAHVREFGEDSRFPALRARLAARDKSLEKVRASKPAEIAAAIEAHVREFGEEAAFGALRDREKARVESLTAISRLGFDEQKKAIEAHVREFGEDPRFPALRALLAAREQALEKVRASKPAELAAAIEAYVREFGEEAALVPLRDRLRRRAESLAAIESLVQGAMHAEAMTAVERHAKEYGEEAGFGELRQETRVRVLVSQGKWDEAGSVVAQAVREFPGQASLRALHQEITARKAAIEQARNEASRRDPEAAAPLLEAALQRYPDAFELRTLLEQMREQVRSRRVQELVKATNDGLDGGDLEAARAAIEAGKREFPKEAQFEALKARLEFAADLQRARLAIESAGDRQALKAAVQQTEKIGQRHKSVPGASSLVAQLKAVAGQRMASLAAAAPAEPIVTRPRWLAPAGAGVLALVAGGVYWGTRESKPQAPLPPAEKKEAVQPAETPIVTAPPVNIEPPKKVEPPPAPPSEAAKGILSVSAGVEGAEVYIGNKLYGRTNADGRFEVTVEAKTHDVRLVKPGYLEPPPNRVKVAENSGGAWNVSLKALDVPVQFEGGTAGAQVRLGDGRLLGLIGQDGRFKTTLPPGDYRVLLSKDQFKPGQFAMRVQPGRPLTIGATQTVLSPAQKTDPQTQAAQEWEKLKNSQDPAAIDDFLQRYRNSPLAAAAEQRADDLRWASLNKRDHGALREFVRRYPASRHARAATDALRELEWAAIDKNSSNALDEFRRRYPDTDEGNRALRELERIRSESKKAEEERGKSAQAADRTAVLAVIERHARAFEPKNFNEISATYPALDTRQLRASLADKNNIIRMTLRPVGDVEIRGDEATVVCDRASTVIVREKAQPPRSSRVKVSLRRSGGVWVIQSID